MTMSDRERRLLAELARRLEEQEPELAAALQGGPEPAAGYAEWCRAAVTRWRGAFRESESAPLRTAVAGGVLFVAGLMLAGNLSGDPTPAPGAQAEVPVFAEQDLIPPPEPPIWTLNRIGP